MRKLWEIVKTWVLNKYVLSILIFAAIMLFAGEQSYRVRIRKARQIRELEEQRDNYQKAIDAARHDIEVLQSTDSLEKFAREQYLMHTEEEEIFLVEE